MDWTRPRTQKQVWAYSGAISPKRPRLPTAVARERVAICLDDLTRAIARRASPALIAVKKRRLAHARTQLLLAIRQARNMPV